MRTLKIVIDAGETTCASEPGKFCKFVRSYTVGGYQFWDPVCKLFRTKEGDPQPLRDQNGWLLRLPECLSAESEG